MAGTRSIGLSLLLLIGATTQAHAQGVVPGGWSNQFHYQPLGLSGGTTPPMYQPVTPPLPTGFGLVPGLSPIAPNGLVPPTSGYGQGNNLVAPNGYPSAYSGRTTSTPFSQSTTQTYSGIDPLSGAISRSVRRGRGR